MRRTTSFNATIYIGLRVGRTADPNPKWHSIQEVEEICRKYCDEISYCVTVTPTKFIYTGGGEDGAIVGLINYPRFPTFHSAIKERAIDLAKMLKVQLEQRAVSIVFPDETVMLDDEVSA